MTTGAGHVLSVQSRTLGSALDGDHSSGVTTITVQDCADFDDVFSGSLSLNGATYTYSNVNDDASTVDISPALVAAGSDGDEVDLLDPVNLLPQVEWTASITVDGEDPGDTIEAAVQSSVLDRLPEGIRGLAGEAVTLQWDENGEVSVADLPGSAGASTSAVKAMQDQLTVAATGDQTLNLTYQPLPDSEHLYWNGVYQTGDQWSRDKWTVTIPDGTGVIEAGDILAMEYLYTDPTTKPAPTSGTITLTAEVLSVSNTNVVNGSSWVGGSTAWSDNSDSTSTTAYTSLDTTVNPAGFQDHALAALDQLVLPGGATATAITLWWRASVAACTPGATLRADFELQDSGGGFLYDFNVPAITGSTTTYSTDVVTGDLATVTALLEASGTRLMAECFNHFGDTSPYHYGLQVYEAWITVDWSA